MLTRSARPVSPLLSKGRQAKRAAGAQTLTRMRRRKGNLMLLVTLVAVLNLIGLVMVLSASSIISIRSYGTPWHFFVRQVLWLAIGSVAFFVAFRRDYHRWRNVSSLAMLASIGLLIAVLVPGVGTTASGASRWLGTSTLEIQPSELAKVALVLFAADILDRRHGNGDWKYEMVPVVCVLLVLGALVMKQPDMGTTMVLATIAVAMLFTAGMPRAPMLGLVGGGLSIALLMAVLAPYRMRRLLSFRNPFKDQSDAGYQSAQGLVSLANGHVLGHGIGASIASYGYLPNAQTDFIFAVIGEETGLLGTLLLSGLFFCLGLVGVQLVCRARDRFGALIAAGITAWLVGQAVINIGAVVGLLPVTGVPLPFVSFGGSSLVIALFGVGVLANVGKQS